MLRRICFLVLHVVTGVYAGACMSIAAIDLRYIKSIAHSAESIPTFRSLLMNMGQVMIPVLAVMVGLMLYFTVLSLRKGFALKSLVPIFTLLLIVGITRAVHIPINTLYLSGSVALAESKYLIQRWDFWHWIRTAVALTLPGTLRSTFIGLR